MELSREGDNVAEEGANGLLLRSEDLGYLGGLISLIYFLKLQNSPATVNLAILL